MDLNDRNCILLKSKRCEQIHFGRNACPNLVFLSPNSISVLILQVHCVKGLGILFNGSLRPTGQIDSVVVNSFIQCAFKSLGFHLFFPLYFALVCLIWNNVCRLGPSLIIRDITRLEKMQEVHSHARYLKYPERLEHLESLSLWRRRFHKDYVKQFKIICRLDKLKTSCSMNLGI